MKPSAIRDLRLRFGETQAQFGERFKVSQITVAYWESGRSQPARRRLDELAALVSSATPVVQVMPPFRPIQYLGSKQRLAATIASVMQEVAPGQSRVGDLFSGSSVVSAVLGATRPVTAVDIQAYSTVLSTALLQGRKEPFLSLTNPTFRNRAEEIASKISESLGPLLTLERKAIAEAGSGSPQHLVELIEFGSIAVCAQRPLDGTPLELARMLDKVNRTLHANGLSAKDLTATRYFGGPYFSYSQAIALDALYLAAKADAATAPSALAVLLSVSSEIVNTVGKQFAQPMKLAKADGRIPHLLLQRALRDRSLNVFDEFDEWARRWAASVPATGLAHAVVLGDAVQFVESDSSCEAWYADPPYTIDHYSRFYHVLETLSLRDAPRLDEMNKRGDPTVMRGVYRAGRYQSPFCIPSQASTAFGRLFAAAARRGTPLVLSYSPFNEEEGQRPRLLTLDEMTGIAKRHYRGVSVMEITDHSHRKLNSKSQNTGIRDDAERLIICEASR